MSDIDEQVQRLLGQDCPIKLLSALIEDQKVSGENHSDLEDLVSVLEIHENEIRRLRQSLNIRLRQYKYSYYIEYMKNHRKEE